MCTDFMRQIFWLNVILTFSSRSLALGMCTYINVSANGTQGSSTDLQQ